MHESLLEVVVALLHYRLAIVVEKDHQVGLGVFAEDLGLRLESFGYLFCHFVGRTDDGEIEEKVGPVCV